MNNYNDIFIESYEVNTLSHQNSNKIEDSIEDFIEQFLDKSVLCNKIPNTCEEIADEKPQKTQIITQAQSNDSQSFHDESSVQPRHKKSIFHNFQKHLITHIKKFMTISKSSTTCIRNLQLANQLWSIFFKNRSFNKRILHLIFGIQEVSNKDREMKKLTSEFEEFDQIYQKYSCLEIQECQQDIRRQVINQAGHISKHFMKSNSNISKFEQFYHYYLSFLTEISEGPMSKRMTKLNKKAVLINIKIKKH